MKYLKTYEKLRKPKFKVGDIIYCIDGVHGNESDVPLTDRKYKLLKIYQESDNLTRIYQDDIEDDQDQDLFVEIKDTITGDILDGWLIYRFVTELEYDAKKYNL